MEKKSLYKLEVLLQLENVNKSSLNWEKNPIRKQKKNAFKNRKEKSIKTLKIDKQQIKKKNWKENPFNDRK